MNDSKLIIDWNNRLKKKKKQSFQNLKKDLKLLFK